MLTTEMSFRKFATTKNEKPTSKKRRSGTSSFKLSEDLKLCMIKRFCIEI